MRTTVLIAALVAGLVTAAPAHAAPECVDVGPGNPDVQPRPRTHGDHHDTDSHRPYHLGGFGFGTPVFGLGGGGIWFGF